MLSFLFFTLAPGSTWGSDENYGVYHGEVVAKWLEEDRRMELIEDLSFVDPNGLVWEAPAGSLVDGASIPSILWSVVGSPFSGKYRKASVIHDVACVEKERTWEVVHLAFYYAMRASGVDSVRAKIMYAGVHHFGPRWPTIMKVKSKVPVMVSKEHCTVTPFGERFCRTVPEVKYRFKAVEIPVLPKPRTLDQSRFDSLVKVISDSEERREPLTIEQIQAFR